MLPKYRRTYSRSYYSTPAAVELLGRWYRTEKEEAFVDFALRDLDIPPRSPIVEIGGGAGLHGIQMQRNFGDRYVHTDLSTPLVETARRVGLRSAVVDGLATPFRSGSVAAVLLVGTSTIVRDEALRIAQFRECGRILTPGGVCIMVTSVLARFKNIHRMNRRDFGLLAEHGLDVTTCRRWGSVPGRLWSRPVKRLLVGVEQVPFSRRTGCPADRRGPQAVGVSPAVPPAHGLAKGLTPRRAGRYRLIFQHVFTLYITICTGNIMHTVSIPGIIYVRLQELDGGASLCVRPVPRQELLSIFARGYDH